MSFANSRGDLWSCLFPTSRQCFTDATLIMWWSVIDLDQSLKNISATDLRKRISAGDHDAGPAGELLTIVPERISDGKLAFVASAWLDWLDDSNYDRIGGIHGAAGLSVATGASLVDRYRRPTGCRLVCIRACDLVMFGA